MLNRRQSMRDHEQRAALHQPQKPFLNEPLSLPIDAENRLVKHENAKIKGQHPREREKLPLSGRQRNAALQDLRLESLKQPRDEAISIHHPRGLFHASPEEAALAKANVVLHKTDEKKDFLKHQTHAPADRSE